MFGYINVNKSELSEENQKIYQAYYCGLCQRLYAHCGKKGQVLLSYDMTFLELLLTGLYEPERSEKQFTCMMHPTKKQTAYENPVSDYCAAINVMLAYHNLVDDWKDEKNYPKKTLANMIRKDYERFASMHQLGHISLSYQFGYLRMNGKTKQAQNCGNDDFLHSVRF